MKQLFKEIIIIINILLLMALILLTFISSCLNALAMEIEGVCLGSCLFFSSG